MKEGEIYRRSELISLLKNEKSGLQDNSYVWIVGNMVKEGILQHEGRNRYSLPAGRQREKYIPDYSEKAQRIKRMVEEKYPRIGFTVFESTLLNEFLNHQIARNTFFIQTERDTSAFVFESLRDCPGGNVLYRPTRKEYDRYWQPDSIVVIDWISEAPIDHSCPHDITIEKLLVDVLCDRVIEMTYSAAEYQNIIETAYQRYFVDTVRLLRYARRRHREEDIKIYIQ